MSVILSDVYYYLDAAFDSPCNYGFADLEQATDEYMIERGGDWCEEHCGKVPAEACWEKYFSLRMAEEGARLDAKTLAEVRAKRYKDQVLAALKDDGHDSLSFKAVDCFVHEEMKEILPLVIAYGEWLVCVRAKAHELYGDETAFYEQAPKIEKLYNDLIALCEKLGIKSEQI